MNAQQLEQLLHQEIPITQALAIQVLDLQDNCITIKAPFEQNKNIHNTAFAGSIYTAATLAGWSLVTHFLKAHDLTGSVVMAKGEIKYLKPINGDILASTQLPNAEALSKIKSQLKLKGRTRFKLIIQVIEEEKVKAELSGDFAVIN